MLNKRRCDQPLTLFDRTICGGNDRRKFNIANFKQNLCVDKLPYGVYIDWQAQDTDYDNVLELEE